MRSTIALVLMLALSSLVDGKTIHVPGDYLTIQEAMDAAMVGDTVLVSPGTYVENIDFKGKDITVKSSDGAASTTIDGNQSESVVRFLNGEGPGATLEGFTLTNGTGSIKYGGGILCVASSPVIQDNIIRENIAGLRGGGVFLEGAEPLIRNNAILLNEADMGGGIYGRLDHAVIQGNTIAGNEAMLGGGAYFSVDSHCLFENNTVTENAAEVGGGFYCYWSDNAVTIRGNEFFLNTAGKGGGLYCFKETKAILSDNSIHHNSAAEFGGGILCQQASPEILNNLLAWNEAKLGGGIACIYAGNLSLVNNTLYGNEASDSGGGLYCYHPNSRPVVANTIFRDNEAPSGPEIRVGYGTVPSELTISYSDVKGGQGSVLVDPAGVLNWGPGMIDADPLFVDPVIGDFHLTFQSPCRGSGDNSAPGVPGHDFEGDPRVYQGTVDMGADEFHPHLYHTGDATPGGVVQGKVVGLPGTSPVGLFIGSGLLNTPLPLKWGLFYLKPPFKTVPLVPIPSGGVYVLPATLPASPPAPYDLYLQALVGEMLTNWCQVKVR